MIAIKRHFFWFKTLFVEMKTTWKKDGLKGLYRKYGFKLFIAFFFYYLIRDSFLYLILPWFFATQLMN
ncbi:MAG: hypothetical protein A2622_10505 [Bdellovibrionales bacterium RIFCSPHIGHO2_01_FULL_40_29]|nr:MAG: hypothetical protein A2622_10505 [Bdellovibrionales bacterium RIFCSPHIGHO2_01_FULL_40_29]OFZ34390.1 MAG: hypothetical protein A3D17_00770 [Bdellovibrionales bacterium RIFCSPHIGHO2_02_FULL_40_15]